MVPQTATVVQTIDWTPVLVVIFTNLAGIIGALAILLGVMKGQFRVLDSKVNGNHNKVLDILKGVVEKSSETAIPPAPRPGRKSDP